MKRVAPVIDIFPHAVSCRVTKQAVADEVAALASLGFRRIYTVVTNPGFPMFSSPWLSLCPSGNPYRNYSMDAILQAADLNFQYAYEIKRQGLEAVAIFKPYEMGGGSTAPHGARLLLERPRVPDNTGDRLHFSSLLERHPEWRVQRFPYDAALAEQPVTALEFAFCLDPITHRTQARQVETIPPAAGDALACHLPRLYASGDGGMYEPYEGQLQVAQRIESRIPVEANGFPLSRDPARFLVVTLTGFTLDAPFWAVSFGESLPTIPDAMIRAFGPKGELPASVTPYIRSSLLEEDHGRGTADRLWGTEYFPCVHGVRDHGTEAQMKHFGFEHGWHGAGFWGPGWKRSAFYGFARGKLSHMKGTPCEGCDGVQADWLGFVEELAHMGYDAVDLRLQNHSGMVADYAAYGFNEPIRRRYREIHGRALTPQADPLEVMAVRGSFFLDFAGKAAKVLHAGQKKLILHLRHCHEEPRPQGEHRLLSDFNQAAFWAMPKVLLDWRRAVDLADEITVKDYFHNRYDTSRAAGIKARAKAQGKPVWMHCYLSQGNELNPDYFGSFAADDNADGLLLYEATHSTDTPENNTGYVWLDNATGAVSLHRPVADRIAGLMEAFGLEG